MNLNAVTPFPLCWPSDRPRTPTPKQSQFRVSTAIAQNDLIESIRKLGAQSWVISSNAPVQKNRKIYARFAEPSDSGVAAYFSIKGKHYVFTCLHIEEL